MQKYCVNECCRIRCTLGLLRDPLQPILSYVHAYVASSCGQQVSQMSATFLKINEMYSAVPWGGFSNLESNHPAQTRGWADGRPVDARLKKYLCDTKLWHQNRSYKTATEFHWEIEMFSRTGWNKWLSGSGSLFSAAASANVGLMCDHVSNDFSEGVQSVISLLPPQVMELWGSIGRGCAATTKGWYSLETLSDKLSHDWDINMYVEAYNLESEWCQAWFPPSSRGGWWEWEALLAGWNLMT